MSTTHLFRAKVWKHPGPAGWHFVTLPRKLSAEIRKKHGVWEEGWGRLEVVARIEGTEWKTSIWYDTQAGGYLLPVKAPVRRKLRAEIGDTVAISLTLPSVMERLMS